MNAREASAQSYWEGRARQFAARGRGLAAVCSYGMPAFYNYSIESAQRRALLPWLPLVAPGSGTALDVGCGVGRWSLELARRGHEVLGLDLSPSMLEQAWLRTANRSGCSFELGDVTTLNLGRKFQLILCVTVLQHVLNPIEARQAIVRLKDHLAPGGTLILLEAARERLGVDGVCEPCALLGATAGTGAGLGESAACNAHRAKLIVRKTVHAGVTVAIASATAHAEHEHEQSDNDTLQKNLP